MSYRMGNLGVEYGGDWGTAAAEGTRAISEAVGAGFMARAGARGTEARARAFAQAAPWIAVGLVALGVTLAVLRK